MANNLRIIRLGLQHYEVVWGLQKDLQRRLIDGTGQNILLLLEHHPVITVGRGAKIENLLLPEEELMRRGVELFKVERGGDVTFHGPGQIVGYPILNLNGLKRDVGWYMRSLEEVIIQTLQHFKVPSERVPGRTGVWTDHHDDATFCPQRKIASIGVRISRWCTMHGFGFNVLESTDGFSLINPCGFTDVKMTSMREERARIQDLPLVDDGALLDATYEVLESTFCKQFGFSGVSEDLTLLGDVECCKEVLKS